MRKRDVLWQREWQYQRRKERRRHVVTNKIRLFIYLDKILIITIIAIKFNSIDANLRAIVVPEAIAGLWQ